VITGSVDGCDQHTEQVHRLVIKRFKIDAVRKADKSAHHMFYAGMRSMRDRHASADPGGAQALSF
jgi:hypothetical protein